MDCGGDEGADAGNVSSLAGIDGDPFPEAQSKGLPSVAACDRDCSTCGLACSCSNGAPELGAEGGNLAIASLALPSKDLASKLTTSLGAMMEWSNAARSCEFRGPFRFCAVLRSFMRYSFVFSSGCKEKISSSMTSDTEAGVSGSLPPMPPSDKASASIFRDCSRIPTRFGAAGAVPAAPPKPTPGLNTDTGAAMTLHHNHLGPAQPMDC
mmetsp:Transcript_6863/g.17250  ORF Transcript_6863/g.17250 Transcript_6863/m.17250 type:complete len:210 (-) Transcript_6863:37-666(-)